MIRTIAFWGLVVILGPLFRDTTKSSEGWELSGVGFQIKGLVTASTRTDMAILTSVSS